MKRKLLIALTMVVFSGALNAVPVLAMDEPDSVSLSGIKVYSDLITTGDMTIIVPYSIPFTTTPDVRLGDAYLFRMLNTDNSTEMGAVVPYPYNELGYGSGIVSFYLATGGIWDTSYVFRVQQNPSYYETPQYWDFVIGPSNYESASDQSGALKTQLITIATDLSLEFGVDLLTSSEGVTTLTQTGELYFLNAIPGLSVMCPDIFSLNLRAPDYTRRSWTTTLAATIATRYSGTFVDDFMTGFAGLTNTDTGNAMNVLSIILFAVVFFISVKWGKGNTTSGLVDGFAMLLLLSINSFFSMVGAGFIAFIAAATGGVILFLNRS